MDHIPTGTGDRCLKVLWVYSLFQLIPPLVSFPLNITSSLEVSKFFLSAYFIIKVLNLFIAPPTSNIRGRA